MDDLSSMTFTVKDKNGRPEMYPGIAEEFESLYLAGMNSRFGLTEGHFVGEGKVAGCFINHLHKTNRK